MKVPALIVCLVSLFNGYAIADAPSVTLQTGASTWTVGLTSTGDGLWDSTNANEWYDTTDSSIEVKTLTLNTDPSIDNAFGVTNNSNSTQQYTMTVNLPVSLLAQQEYLVSTSFGATVTNATSSIKTITVSPVSTYLLNAYVGATNLTSVDLVSSPLTFLNVGGHKTVTDPDDIEASSTYIATGTETQMSVVTTFKLSAHSSAGFSYDFTVEAVPEPSTYALLFLSVGGLFVASRFRRRAIGVKVD